MSGGSDKGKGEGTKVEATEADVVAVAAEGEPAVEVARADEVFVPADTDALVGEEHEDAEFSLEEPRPEWDDSSERLDQYAVTGLPVDTSQPMGLEHPLPDGRFADRELSWIAFNERVLEQSEDEGLPLLERLWFSAIFSHRCGHCDTGSLRAGTQGSAGRHPSPDS